MPLTTAPDEQPPASLDRSLVSGLAWTAGLKWIGQLVSWVVTIFAARHLSPGEYGLVSMANLALGLARLVQDCGLDSILIQDRKIAGRDQARLTGLILLLGAGLWLLFIGLSEPLAVFFKEPALVVIIIALGGIFLTDALQVVPRAQLQRELRYSALAGTAFVQLAATQIALVLGILAGLGYWALVLSTLTGEIAVTLVLLRVSPFAVAWPRELRTLTTPLRSGWRMLASRAAYYGYSNADQTIIGRVLGKDALGIYSFATSFSSIPQQQVGSIVSGVVPGIMSRVQTQPSELRRYFLKLTEFVTVLSFPLSVGMALVADMVLPLVLGPQWNDVIVPLRLLCAYSVFQSSQMMISHVMLWTGQFRAFMWCSILAGVMMPPVLYLGARLYGVAGVGWMWVFVFPLANLPSFYFAFRTAQVRTIDWLVALAPAGVSCLTMMMAVIGMREIMPLEMHPWARAGVAIGTGAGVYLLTLWFGFRQRVMAAITLGRSLRT